jgi:hypothetical protein
MHDSPAFFRRHVVAVLTTAAILTAAGCSKLTYVPVKGKVVLKKGGKPVTFGTVVFVPDKDNALRKMATGTINPDGTYELSTEGKDGVPIGSYIACVRGPIRKVDGKEPPPIPFSMKWRTRRQVRTTSN